MMHNFFECKIKYEKVMEDGTNKNVSELYLLDALSFTEAEKKQIDNTPWRAKIGGKYYYIDSNLNIYSDKDMYKYRDNSRYYACNYAKTEKELEIKRNKIKKILEGE